MHARGERLGPLRAVTIDGDGLQAHLPSIDVGLHDLVHGDSIRHVDCLGNCSADKWLDRAHHLDVSHVVDAARSLGGFEGAVEDWKVLRLQVGCSLYRVIVAEILEDRVGLCERVSEPLQRFRYGVVYYLDDSAAEQPLILD